VTARLAGTGRLADDLYLMAHNENTGKLQLSPRALGLGLAGGLLAELLLAGRINIAPAGVMILSRTPPAERVARSVFETLLGEGEQHPAADWLKFLGQTSAVDVAGRLEESGYLTRIASKVPWRGDRFVPVDPDCAFAPLTRALTAMDKSQAVHPIGATLAGLATACGLGSRMVNYSPPNARRVEDAVEQLWPGLRDLISQTRAAVDSAVLAHRV
jgi:hypothetical protein